MLTCEKVLAFESLGLFLCKDEVMETLATSEFCQTQGLDESSFREFACQSMIRSALEDAEVVRLLQEECGASLGDTSLKNTLSAK